MPLKEVQEFNLKSIEELKSIAANLRARCKDSTSWLSRAGEAIRLHHQFDPLSRGAAALGREKFHAVVECYDILSMTPAYIGDWARFVADDGCGDAADEGMRLWAHALLEMVQEVTHVTRSFDENYTMLQHVQLELAKRMRDVTVDQVDGSGPRQLLGKRCRVDADSCEPATNTQNRRKRV